MTQNLKDANEERADEKGDVKRPIEQDSAEPKMDQKVEAGFLRKLTADAKFTAIVGLIGAILGALATLIASSASGQGGCQHSSSIGNQTGGSK